ncbi:MAG TPA: winged helix-turn-helix transcriptional regulator [Candidatus Bathyarchaeia archaeon]|nr:winged helix-turn-helix transcriptional regulator [Candidatus Bathyarchaeia archaeon]
MPKKLEFRDLRTIEALEVEGPRNITEVARKLGMPAETLRKRVRRMTSRFSLRFYLNIYHANLGLKKAVVFAQANPGYENMLFDSLKTNDFWLSINRCYGMNEGCFAIYTIPSNQTGDFEAFVRHLQDIGVASQSRLVWSTCFHYVHLTSKWFDKASKIWNFKWDDWTKEIPKQGVKLPPTLLDPEEFPIKGDKTDILILKELEKNPLIRMTELAKRIGISQQLAAYHYLRHIKEQGLIESFEIAFSYFDKPSSDNFVFLLEFSNYENFAKFSSSLLDKPFARGLGKVLGQNALLAHLYLPRSEFRRFVSDLSGFIRAGMLENYSYIILDPSKSLRQTISYEHFEKKKWQYNHEKHIKNLEKIVKDQGPSKRAAA